MQRVVAYGSGWLVWAVCDRLLMWSFCNFAVSCYWRSELSLLTRRRMVDVAVALRFLPYRERLLDRRRAPCRSLKRPLSVQIVTVTVRCFEGIASVADGRRGLWNWRWGGRCRSAVGWWRRAVVGVVVWLRVLRRSWSLDCLRSGWSVGRDSVHGRLGTFCELLGCVSLASWGRHAGRNCCRSTRSHLCRRQSGRLLGL